LIHRDQVFALTINKLCMQHFLHILALSYLQSSHMRVNLPIIRKHKFSIASGKSTSSLSQEGRWKRSINRTGVILVAIKPAWLLAHRLCQACVAQVRSPSIPLVCLFLLYPRQNRITHGFLSSTRRARFVPEE